MPGLEGVERISIGRHSSTNLSELKQWKAIAVAPGEETTIELVYAGPAYNAKVSIRRSGFRNHFIRWMSEFRDRLLSTHAFTRQVIALVNKMLHNKPAMYLEDSYGGR